MAININQNDTLLFEQNGYTYNDIKNTIEHYRSNGISDEDIQSKLDTRLEEFRNLNKNKQALENSIDLDNSNPYVKQCNKDLEQLSSIYFSPEELTEIDSKGAIGWWELAKKSDKTEKIPFWGSIESGGKAGRLGIISKKIENGEEINSNDKEFIDNYLKEYIEVSRRGTTWGAKVANVLMDVPAWAAEIGSITLLTGGTGTIPTIAKKVAEKSGVKAALAYTTKALIKSAQTAGVKGIVAGAAKSNIILAPRIAENYAQRRITEGIAITDKGQAYLEEIEENPATTLIKALADTNIEAGTELIAGQYLNLGGSLVAKSPAGKAITEGFKKGFDLLPKKTRAAFESAVQKLRPNETIESIVKKGGFNGVLEEMGEERVADILKTTLDLDAEEGYNADQFLRAINPKAEELLVELGAFSIMGGASRASSILYNNLRVKGYNHEEATNTVNNLSETEKDNLLNAEIVKDDYTVNSDITAEDVLDYESSNFKTIENNPIFTDFYNDQIKESTVGELLNHISINEDIEDVKDVKVRKSNEYKKDTEFKNDYIYGGSAAIENGEIIIYTNTTDLTPEQVRDNLFHELQHARQIKEALNGNIEAQQALMEVQGYVDNNDYEKYKNSTYEVSADLSRDFLKNKLERYYERTKQFNTITDTENVGNNQLSNSNGFENSNVDTRGDDTRGSKQGGLETTSTNSEEETTRNNKTTKERLEEERQNYKEYKKVKKESERFWNKILAPISTELDEINPKLKHALRRFEMDSALKENEYAKPVQAYFKAVEKMSIEDYSIYDLALKNRDVDLVNELNKEYGIQKEFKAIRQLLDNIYKDAKNVGMEIGMLEDYFPRKVINPAAFIEEVSKSTFIRKALKEIDADNKMSNEDKAIAVNNILRGYGNKINLSGGSFTKERRVQEITPELNIYYKDSLEALADYIKSMNNVISAKKFFGKGENVEDSIGAYVKSLTEEGLISARDEARAKEILTARFNQKGVGELLSAYKNISYITTMGNPLSAITQIGDLAFSLYKNGFYNSFIGFNEAITGKGITREELGIDKIAQEFSEKSKTSQAVNNIFKAVGLDFMDKMGKETFINASYKRLTSLANSNNKQFDNMLNQIFGKEAQQVKEDLKNNIFTENVKYLLFSELSDFQPISLAEMPQKYLTGGNARVFYQLKTYTIKQLDVYRNQIFRQFQNDRVGAIKNLIKLSAMLIIANATADALKDLLLGRPIELEDLVVDNLLRIAGFSKWQVYKARREGAFTTILQSILPPTNILDDLYKDSIKTLENGEISFNELNIIKDIPLAGKLYYWWFGKGSKIENKSSIYNKFSKKFNQAKKANDKLKDLQGEEAIKFAERKEKDLENYRILKGYDKQIKNLRRQRNNFEKSNNRDGIKSINLQIDEISKAGLEALE